MKAIILAVVTVSGVAMAQGKDLRGLYLYGAQLKNVDLRGADLRGAVFSKKLNGAELSRVNLSGAKFDEKTVLPFEETEALRRGMVKVDTLELPSQLPASREPSASPVVAAL